MKQMCDSLSMRCSGDNNTTSISLAYHLSSAFASQSAACCITCLPSWKPSSPSIRVPNLVTAAIWLCAIGRNPYSPLKLMITFSHPHESSDLRIRSTGSGESPLQVLSSALGVSSPLLLGSELSLTTIHSPSGELSSPLGSELIVCTTPVLPANLVRSSRTSAGDRNAAVPSGTITSCAKLA
jgi:hypothetical protein